MKITFSLEEKVALIKEIQNFFCQEKGEKIGIIAAENLLDFFIENLGTKIYNKALDDAKVWFSKRMDIIEIDYDLLYQQIDER